MSNLDSEYIFFDSLDTFKVFDNLDLNEVNYKSTETSETIWQVLNHLINWQQYQIEVIDGKASPKDIAGKETRITGDVTELSLVNSAIATFKSQSDHIKTVISGLSAEAPETESKLRSIKEIRDHLSIHIKEIITTRRQLNGYPMPGEMTEFLSR